MSFKFHSGQGSLRDQYFATARQGLEQKSQQESPFAAMNQMMGQLLQFRMQEMMMDRYADMLRTFGANKQVAQQMAHEKFSSFGMDPELIKGLKAQVDQRMGQPSLGGAEGRTLRKPGAGKPQPKHGDQVDQGTEWSGMISGVPNSGFVDEKPWGDMVSETEGATHGEPGEKVLSAPIEPVEKPDDAKEEGTGFNPVYGIPDGVLDFYGGAHEFVTEDIPGMIGEGNIATWNALKDSAGVSASEVMPDESFRQYFPVKD